MFRILSIFFFLLILSCSKAGTEMENVKESIGVATMLPDGTIVLQLRAETDGTLGEAYYEYRPDDSRYEEIKKHIGGIKVGEQKFVPPWD